MPEIAKVLVIDDEPSIRLLCRLDLQYDGFDVIEAADGAEGLELANREHPNVIVLDRMMPVIDGITVLREIRRNADTADIPVLMLTARSFAGAKLESWIAGATEHLEKPFLVRDLTDTVRRLSQMTPKELREHRADLRSRVRELAAG